MTPVDYARLWIRWTARLGQMTRCALNFFPGVGTTRRPEK